MPQHAAGLFHILPAELDGTQRCAAHGHQQTKGHEQVDQRKRDRHGGKRQMSHTVADIDAEMI